MAVLPSADSATDWPCAAPNPAAPLPTSLACSPHNPLAVKNTHAAPTVGTPGHCGEGASSHGPPTMAVLPSAESATEVPCCAPNCPTAPVPTSLSPCWLHTPPLRANTQAAPASKMLSKGPPTM